MSSPLTREMIEQIRLVQSVKGVDYEELEFIAKQHDMPVEVVVQAVMGREVIDRISDYTSSIERRIDEAEHNDLSDQYISGLRDALKLIQLEGNPHA